jgi:hypothetical protein
LNILNVLSVQLPEHSGYGQAIDYYGNDEAGRCQEWVDGLDLAVEIYNALFEANLSDPDSTFDTRNLEANMEVQVGAEIDRYNAFCASS